MAHLRLLNGESFSSTLNQNQIFASGQVAIDGPWIMCYMQLPNFSHKYTLFGLFVELIIVGQ
jgi:hypothetical protein